VAERLLDVRIPDDWPDAELAELLPVYADRLREDPRALGYGTWLLVERVSRTVVGSAGFLGSPTSEGTVELGYGVHHEHRKRGYATEAARALVAWALAQDGVVRVTARCRPANLASIRVLGNVGLEQTGELDGLTHWTTPLS
jgi:ribosomal-protein-alanine N-acetyltransferase